MRQPLTPPQAELRAVRRGANRAAVIVLVLVLTDALIDFALIEWNKWEYGSFVTFSTWVRSSMQTQLLFDVAVYLITMGTAAVCGCLLVRHAHYTAPRQENRGVALAAVCACLGLCIAANIAESVVMNYFAWFGIEPTDLPVMQDGTFLAWIENLGIVALLPAILEELVFRKAVLTALRPAGDAVAVTVSALLFGLMHERLQQIPFAFLLGLALGYLTVRTGKIWLSMLVHGLNNAISVTMEYATWGMTDSMASRVYTVLFAVLILIGVAAFCVLLLQKRTTVSTLGERPRMATRQGARVGAIFSAPLCIVVIVLLLFLTAQNIVVSPVPASDESPYEFFSDSETA